ncbi:MAG: CheR family methyltransferase [Promethearchaeota archaeon]
MNLNSGPDLEIKIKRFKDNLKILPRKKELDGDSSDNNRIDLLIKRIISGYNIDLQKYRRAYIERRLKVMMYRYKIQDYKEFLNLLEQKHIKKEQFLHWFTINVTKFFRDIEPFRYFESKILPKLIALDLKNVYILSAGCATGEEPYSIAIIIDYFLKKRNLYNKINFNIDAIDIDPNSIKAAEEGIYFKEQLVNISSESLRRNFIEINENIYKIKDHLKKYINFNVKDINQLKNQNHYFCIFCRNVLIYIDKEMQNNIIKIFWQNLMPNGYLILGKTETINSQNSLFEYENLKEHIYKKIMF